MSLTVKKHWAERFIDWFPTHTKLYIRGEKGKNWEETNKLYRDLFHQLAPFLDKLKEEGREEAYQEGYSAAQKELNSCCDPSIQVKK